MSLEVSIKKKFRGFCLDEDFEAGGTLGILGESGSGKTLTLKCIAGIIKPDKGKIVLNGKTLYDSEKRINLPPAKRKIGYMFQNYALFPNMTVEENILAGIDMPKEQKRRILSKALPFFGLEDVGNKYPAEISGGEAQRCALARIVVRKPDLILLDEPFSALDSFRKYTIEDELFEILDKLGIPVIMVSHDKNEIYRRCPESCVLEKGKSLGVKPAKELFARPEFVSEAKLTGVRNFFRANRISENEIEVPELNLKLNCSKGCDYIGINQKDIRFSEEGGILIKGEVHSVTEDSSENIICVRSGGKKIFAASCDKEKTFETGGEITLSVDEDKILFLKERG